MSTWDELKKEISDIGEMLWRNPELPLMEYYASDTLIKWLQTKGFKITRNLGGYPTAFKAEWGSGYPNIGMIAEYDALPGLSNHNGVTRKSLKQEAGHGCLHNHIGALNTGVAIAIKQELEKHRLKGTITVIGCPAEEIVMGKVALLHKGGFKGIDLLLTSHVDYQNAVLSRPSLAALQSEFAFSGVANHTGISRKQNALDSAELFIQTIEKVRYHRFPNVSIEHVIRHGGVAPNIATDFASVWISMRSNQYNDMISAYEEIKAMAQQCAFICQVDNKEGFIASTHGYLPNDTVGDILYSHMKQVEIPRYTESECSVLKELIKNATNLETFTLDENIKYLKEGIEAYSQDDGEVSFHIPLGRMNWTMPQELPLHNWATTAFAGMEMSYKGAFMVGEVLISSAIEMFKNPDLVKLAREELESRVKNNPIMPATFNDGELLRKNPEAFWKGEWL